MISLRIYGLLPLLFPFCFFLYLTRFSTSEFCGLRVLTPIEYQWYLLLQLGIICAWDCFFFGGHRRSRCGGFRTGINQ